MWPFSHWAGKLSPSPRLAPLSHNLDHCNQRCIHQPQNNHQSDIPTGILIHPSVKQTDKTNNEKIVAMWPLLIEQGNWAHLLALLLWVATWTIVINATINQISKQGYLFTLLWSRPSKQTMKKLLLCGPFLNEQRNWAHLLAWLLWVATWTIVINAASTSHKATINQTWNPILPYYFFHSCRSLGFLIMHNSYALLSERGPYWSRTCTKARLLLLERNRL